MSTRRRPLCPRGFDSMRRNVAALAQKLSQALLRPRIRVSCLSSAFAYVCVDATQSPVLSGIDATYTVINYQKSMERN